MRKANGSVGRVAAAVLKGWYDGRRWNVYRCPDDRVMYVDVDAAYYVLILPAENPLDAGVIAARTGGIHKPGSAIPIPPEFVEGPWADVQPSARTDAPFKYQLHLSDDDGRQCTVDSRFAAKIALDTGERGLAITGGERPVVAVCDYTGLCLGYVLPVVGSGIKKEV